MNSDLLVYIIGIVIVAVIIGLLIYEMKNTKDGEEEVEKFLASIKDSLMQVIVDQIDTFDTTVLKDKESMENFEKKFLDSVYSAAIKVALEQLEKIKSTHPITYAIIKKTITEDKINQYINTIFSDKDIKSKIEELYKTALAAKMKKMAEDDAALEAKQDLYDQGLDNSVEVAPVEENIDPDRGVQQESEIIPPSDATANVIQYGIDESVTQEEFEQYNAIANKTIMSVKERKPIEVIRKD